MSEHLELAARLMEAARGNAEVSAAMTGAVARFGAEDLADFAARFPDEFEVIAEALIDMVDEVRNVRGLRDA
jgi:hypothetical protein